MKGQLEEVLLPGEVVESYLPEDAVRSLQHDLSTLTDEGFYQATFITGSNQ